MFSHLSHGDQAPRNNIGFLVKDAGDIYLWLQQQKAESKGDGKLQEVLSMYAKLVRKELCPS